jgi:hypothetical protein
MIDLQQLNVVFAIFVANIFAKFALPAQLEGFDAHSLRF